MAVLTSHSKIVLRHMLGNIAVVGVLLAFAIALTFLSDWCVQTHRPKHILRVIDSIEFATLAADGVILLAVLWEGVKLAWKKALK
jgi:hypothetical protein